MMISSQEAMKQPTSDTVMQALKQKGLRVTPQRYAVYANLLSRYDHPTAEQLLSDLNQDFPISSQATVYSSIKALQNAGLVREVLLEEGVSRFDANVEPHHHFQCRCCGAIEDISWEAFLPLSLAGLRAGIQPERYEVTVFGRCEQCAPGAASGSAVRADAGQPASGPGRAPMTTVKG